MCDIQYNSHFTPLESTLGGLLIGSACASMLLFNGRITGMSGILSGVVKQEADAAWRGIFILFLMLGGIIAAVVDPGVYVPELDVSPFILTVAGLAVGFGTTLGTGCTSGHAICGVSRLTKRSIVATANMMAFGAITVFVHRHLLCDDGRSFNGLVYNDELPMNLIIASIAVLVLSNVVLFIVYKSYHESNRADSLVVAALGGLQFGLGLAVSGMVNTYKVKAFLDFAGAWDPSLMFVMIGAYIVTMPSFHVILHRKVPITTCKFSLPTKKDLTWQLLLGSAVFGIGWGLVGICPGPMMVNFIRIYWQSADILIFTFYVIVGIFLNKALESHLAARAKAKTSDATPLASSPIQVAKA